MPVASGPVRCPVRPALRLVPLALCAAAVSPSLAAQAPVESPDTAAVYQSPWRIGGSFGMPAHRLGVHPLAFTVGMHLAYLPEGPLGLDLSVGTAPATLAAGVGSIGARAGLTFPLRRGPSLVLPSAGVSYIGVAMDGTPDGAWGPHLGLALVDGRGLRLGLTTHWIGDPWPIGLFEVGILARREAAQAEARR